MALIMYLTRIQFGTGCLDLLDKELALLKVARPMIVTDKGLVDSGLVRQVVEKGGLPADTVVYSGTKGNPDEESVLEAHTLFVESRCDGIIALGGGSPIDLAKAVSLLATHEGPLEQYAAILGGVERITANKPPVVAVATTAGTGSEVGRAALITLKDGRKLGFISPHMIPDVALCDPALTVGLPARLTAATGMDAVAHCIETYLSPRVNPPAEAIALDGLRRAFQHLETAVHNGHDIQAREEMMMAALEGGMAFQKGLGAVHGLSHALGGLEGHRLHHGTLNAVLLPAVLRFNESHVYDKYVFLRRAMGLAEGASVADAITDLIHRLGLPDSLSAMGVPEDCVDLMAERALADHSTATNPRPMVLADYVNLFKEAY